MITVIENINFVEGIFKSYKNAENYLTDHPKKENCKILDLNIKKFPFYIVEINFGDFVYFSSKEEIIVYLMNFNMDIIKNKKSTNYLLYKCNEILETEREVVCEKSITIYVIKKPFKNKVKNVDTMGAFEHYHIEQDILLEVKDGKNNGLLSYLRK
jgi:hypothetical protein